MTKNVVTLDSEWNRALIVSSGPVGTVQQKFDRPPCNSNGQMTRIKCNGTVKSCHLLEWPGSRDGMIIWNCEKMQQPGDVDGGENHSSRKGGRNLS